MMMVDAARKVGSPGPAPLTPQAAFAVTPHAGSNITPHEYDDVPGWDNGCGQTAW